MPLPEILCHFFVNAQSLFFNAIDQSKSVYIIVQSVCSHLCLKYLCSVILLSVSSLPAHGTVYQYATKIIYSVDHKKLIFALDEFYDFLVIIAFLKL